jgi:hypothetical protein
VKGNYMKAAFVVDKEKIEIREVDIQKLRVMVS